MLGFGAISEGPISDLPDAFAVALPPLVPEQRESLIQVVSFLDSTLIDHYRSNPLELQLMNRRRFEELVAELFSGFGYAVELTKRTRDGGKDIIAIRRGEVDVRYLIECKRPDPTNPIGVSTVRELLGVKEDDGATKAILATTGYFTKDATEFIERHRWELEARDFDAIKEWLARYARVKGS